MKAPRQKRTPAASPPRQKRTPVASPPRQKRAETAFNAFCATIAALRHPQTGCPWDLEQTHLSLRTYMLEEAYEAVEAMTRGNANDLRDELGDVFLQVVLNAQLARDSGAFDLADVIEAINAKMLRRHPHVFGEASDKTNRSKKEIRRNWESIKDAEKKGAKKRGPPSYFADAESTFPATTQASKIGKLAQKIKFDWNGPKPVLEKLISEIDELRVEFARWDTKKESKKTQKKTSKRPSKKPSKTTSKIPSPALVAELGDVYFTLGQLCRHLALDPEVVALDGNRKFLGRFAVLEELARSQKIALANASQDTLENLWAKAKETQSRG